MNIRDGNLEKAHQFYAKDDYASSYALYEDLLRKDPEDREVLYEYGRAIFSEFGDLEKATHLFEHFLEIEPDSVVALLYLGTLYSMGYGKGYPEALPIYQRILTLSRSNKEAMVNAFIGIGMLHHVPNSPVSYEEVITAFRKALEIDPQRADAHQNLGVALLEGDKRQEAWKELKIAENLLKKMGIPTEGVQKLLHVIERNELFTRGPYINLSSQLNWP
ncbi:MAG: tetratricopeptide repeat protein [Ktedonobacteraceae bacterium]|nr:tetratricopeptide repeat protein [Ktedonobacteraceae bacterium]